ncbi:MAG: DUF4395 domain-containing protein [Sporolactobacillus sp.]
MPDMSPFIPRPLVRTNQSVIVIAAASSLASGQYWILLIPLASALSGLIFHFNPIFKIAGAFLRKPLTAYAREDPAQQRFNQTIAASLLVIAFAAFLLHWQVIAVIATGLVGLAALIAILGFCIGCYIHYRFKRRLLLKLHRHKRHLRRNRRRREALLMLCK